MPADTDIVAYLHQVVDLGALADHGIADRTAVDGSTGADFHIVLDDDAADLRDFKTASAAHHEAKAILADLAAAMNDDPIADQGVADRGAGADRAVAADPDLGTDHAVGAYHRAGADLGARPDDRAGFQRDAAFQARGRMHMGARHIVRRIERGRPQRMREQLARDDNESTKWLRHDERGDAGRQALRQRCGRQASAGVGLRRPGRQIGRCRERSDRTARHGRARQYC